MKTKLLYTKQFTRSFYAVLAFSLCVNLGWSQNLVQNPTCDIHGTGSGSTTDNADAYDMTPSNDILDEMGNTIPSPYQAVWDNDALEDWLEIQYLGAAGTLDEQPGSTSSGNMSRGIKLYDDGNPNLNTAANTTGNFCSRRIYQRVNGLTPGATYTFSVESFAESTGTPSEMYILNTEIVDEIGINTNGGSDAVVDGFLNVTNDTSGFTANSFDFVATNNFVVIYIRSLNSIDGNTEVFYDNFSIVAATASVDDFSIENISIYPNPTTDILKIESKNGINISTVQVFDTLGKQVMNTELRNNTLNVSELSKGLYLVKMISEFGNEVTQKIVIE